MKISKLKLKNFRSYRSVEISFENLTAFIGRNDIGKSTILEALDIFFNEGKGVVKLEANDLNTEAKGPDEQYIEITVCFNDLPTEITIDSTYLTTLEDEFLLNEDKELEVIKRHPLKGLKEQVYLSAYHPSDQNCSDLYTKKSSDLKKIIKDAGIPCENNSINAIMRSAIWKHYDANQHCELKKLDLAKEDGKNIWEKIKEFLPQYSLFQSDRKNSDNDSEVQDPLKEATKEIISSNNLEAQFNEIATEVTKKLRKVANSTLSKLKEMNPDIAEGLEVKIPEVKELKWAELFKSVSIEGNDGIAMNKRGSGVRRLILLNFFRAKAEEKASRDNRTLIYAIEEPETSQHNEHQKILIDALKELANKGHQILLTTHSGHIVKQLDFNQLRLARLNNNKQKEVVEVDVQALPYPSLNEINYIAFGDTNAEYHDELYGHLELQGQLASFEQGKSKRPYIKCWHGKSTTENISLAKYIRHQIHHPENTQNRLYTSEELQQSIEEMRAFLISVNSSNK